MDTTNCIGNSQHIMYHPHITYKKKKKMYHPQIIQKK